MTHNSRLGVLQRRQRYQEERHIAHLVGDTTFPASFTQWVRRASGATAAKKVRTVRAAPRPAPAALAAAPPAAPAAYGSVKRAEAARMVWTVQKTEGRRRGHPRGGEARNARPVQTPAGRYGSIVEAAAAFSVHKSTALRWAEAGKNGWSFVDD